MTLYVDKKGGPEKPGLEVGMADWTCPAMDNRTIISRLDQEIIASLADVEKVKNLVDEEARQTALQTGNHRFILPAWQNLEALVYGSRIIGKGKYFLPSGYCVKNLADIRDMDYNMTEDPLIRTVIHAVPSYVQKNLVLEAEAPFTILAGLMNPMDLYQCSREQGKLLQTILHRIAEASADYIKACITAGCRIISLADPAGTMDLVGPDYYKLYCGDSELYLMEKLDAWLDGAVVHVCKKMSMSLLIAGMAEVKEYKQTDPPGKTGDIMDRLAKMADNPDIHFTGMTCMHN